MTDLELKKPVRAAPSAPAPSPVPNPSSAVALLGIGTAVPPSITQVQAAALAEEFSCQTAGQRAWLQRVFSRAGVERRGSVLENPERNDGAGVRAFYGPPAISGEHGPSTSARMQRYAREAPPLMERAALAALAAAGVPARGITHIITVSCTGFHAPGLDVELIARLGLAPTVGRTHIGFMGCHAAFNALAAARQAVRADPAALVMVCCVELCTLHFAYGWNPEKLVANALFADGAAACVVGASDALEGPAPAQGRPWRLLETASLLLPDSRKAMTWTVGDHGFEMTLSSELPALIGSHIRPWCESWLGDLGLTLADIDRWAIHPGGPKILTAARDALSLPESAIRPSLDILARHGNMSSATVLFLLDEIARTLPSRTAEHTPERCVAIGFGPGLMAEGLLLEL